MFEQIKQIKKPQIKQSIIYAWICPHMFPETCQISLWKNRSGIHMDNTQAPKKKQIKKNKKVILCAATIIAN